jgi:TonB family protein
MPKNLRFWMNVALIAGAHVVVVIGLIRWSRESKDANAQSVVWMSGGGGDGAVSEKKTVALPPKAPRKESRTEPLKERDPEEDHPFLASAPSEIQLPTPTGTPVRSPSPRSTSTPKVTPSPKIKGTPKAKPTPTRTPKPKPSPKKLVLAKASPKPSAKATIEKAESEPEEGPSEKPEIAKAVPVKEDLVEKESKKTAATQTGSGKGTTAGTGGGRTGGSANEGQFAWYGSMLHDRFYSEWVQPTNVAGAGAKNSVLVKLRIEKDGRISNFEIVRSSGNAELDESVKALANRVSRVESLPDGLGKGDHYDVKINFELNSE